MVALLVLAALRSGALEAFDAVILSLRAAGPAVFFFAMAVLPAAGFPMFVLPWRPGRCSGRRWARAR